jgi:large subunit ribosomal protein L10
MRAARAGGDEAVCVGRSRAFLFRPVPHCAPGRSSFPGPFAARNVVKREEATVAKPDKVDAVTEIADKFRASSAAVVTEYRGLSMAQLSTLRRTLGVGVSYRVAKNTLVKRAAQDAGVQGLDDLFVGPTAIAFVEGEPVDAAKALRDFAKDNKALVIKGGFMDGKALSVDEVTKIADLDSREVLLAKLAGAMKGNLSKAAALFNAPTSKFARLAAALQEKKAAEEGGAAE